jgi:hypothetical protein
MRHPRRDQHRATATHALSLAILMIGVAVPTTGIAQSSRQPLSSAAIDPSIYREGEVKRFSETHGAWTVVCDEIARLKQRFCSLRSPIPLDDGRTAAVLTISTGQDGRPAAMLRMTADLVASGYVDVAPAADTATNIAGPSSVGQKAGAAAAKQKAKLPPSIRVKPVSCDKGVCTLIWTLTGDQIGALNTTRGLRLAATAAGELSSLATLSPEKSKLQKPVELMVVAHGFSEAVGTSMKPFE